MTDVFPALTLDAVCDLLLAAQRPLILSHARPDGDTIGSAAALCLFFARRGTPAAFACAVSIRSPLPTRSPSDFACCTSLVFRGLYTASNTPSRAGKRERSSGLASALGYIPTGVVFITTCRSLCP